MASSLNQLSQLIASDWMEKRAQYSTQDVNHRLRQAAFAGDLEEVTHLLQHPEVVPNHCQKGINPHSQKPYSGKTALHHAVAKGHPTIAILLIQHGWSPFTRDSKGTTPDSLAATDPDIQKVLRLHSGILLVCKRLTMIFLHLGLLERLPKISPDYTIRVLSLACGNAHEFRALAMAYPALTFECTGIDNSEDMLEEARNICENIPNVRFVHADATDIPTLQSTIEGRFDLVFVRHPDIFNQQNTFNSILHHTVPAFIQAQGLLFCSTYHAEEMKKVGDILLQQFYSSTGRNFCDTAEKDPLIRLEDVNLTPDQYSVVMEPSPPLQCQITGKSSPDMANPVDEKTEHSGTKALKPF
ncbi:MAG: methyltransferase domain-containing protein [Legionellaceae bacterium]|nr:methyltransferase domain-containing protein [Legionellaceae bacterium]